MPLLLRGDARNLPLPDSSVDLICTSPPYFGLRDYGYDGQIGSEPTPKEFLDALIACTAEMVRVLKPSGSLWINLGDKYAGSTGGGAPSASSTLRGNGHVGGGPKQQMGAGRAAGRILPGRPKSLMLLPERYRIRCVDELDLIARAVLIWSKPNGLPESVTDRVRRSHEDWVHLTKAPRYFSAVDEIREQHTGAGLSDTARGLGYTRTTPGDPSGNDGTENRRGTVRATNPLGKLPGSVWTIPTQPLTVPAALGVDHFAAFPMAWPRRIIQGWSPREVCTACGEGRRPVVDTRRMRGTESVTGALYGDAGRFDTATGRRHIEHTERTLTGWACDCPDTTSPSTLGVVLDPFSGTGTTALVAAMLGRRGIGVELSADYLRLAQWRASDPKERARAAGLDPDVVSAIKPQITGQGDLFDEDGAA
jgi:DNA modification methylase